MSTRLYPVRKRSLESLKASWTETTTIHTLSGSTVALALSFLEDAAFMRHWSSGDKDEITDIVDKALTELMANCEDVTAVPGPPGPAGPAGPPGAAAPSQDWQNVTPEDFNPHGLSSSTACGGAQKLADYLISRGNQALELMQYGVDNGWMITQIVGSIADWLPSLGDVLETAIYVSSYVVQSIVGQVPAVKATWESIETREYLSCSIYCYAIEHGGVFDYDDWRTTIEDVSDYSPNPASVLYFSLVLGFIVNGAVLADAAAAGLGWTGATLSGRANLEFRLGADEPNDDCAALCDDCSSPQSSYYFDFRLMSFGATVEFGTWFLDEGFRSAPRPDDSDAVRLTIPAPAGAITGVTLYYDVPDFEYYTINTPGHARVLIDETVLVDRSYFTEREGAADDWIADPDPESGAMLTLEVEAGAPGHPGGLAYLSGFCITTDASVPGSYPLNSECP